MEGEWLRKRILSSRSSNELFAVDIFIRGEEPRQHSLMAHQNECKFNVKIDLPN